MATASPAQASATPASSFVTQDQFNTGLSALNNSLRELFFQNISTPGSLPATGGYTNAIALTNRIDNLDNVTISNATVNGVSGLTAADIPSLNYLPLSGGNITFASSTQFSIFNKAYFGGTATSTFGSDGTLTLAQPLAVGSGGTGWNNLASGAILFGNGPSALATSSNIFWDNTNSRLGISTTSPATTVSVTGSGYFTGGFGVGILNATVGTVAASTSYAVGPYTIITSPIAPNQGTDAVSNISLGYNALTSISPLSTTRYNTAIGYQTLNLLTTGDHNTAVGVYSLNSITASSHNTGLGIDTMRFMTSGQDNTAVGEQSLNNATSSNQNTSVGRNAMLWSGGSYNTALGYFSMSGSSTLPVIGQGNTALGPYTLGALAGNADYNTAVGMYALNNAATTTADTALGYDAGTALLSGTNNTLLGYAVGYTAPTTGNYNILIGVDQNTNTAFGYSTGAIGIGQFAKPGTNDTCVGKSACSSTTQDNNTNSAFGLNALSHDSTGSQNVAVGFNAGASITGGYYNTALGVGSGGTTLATGHDNILIGTGGNKADTPTSGTNYFLNIGNIIFGTSINSTGNVSIGTTTPYSRLTVWGPDSAASTSAFLVANNASTTEFAVLDNGNATLAGNLIQNSDQRLKTNIQSLDASSSLAAIEALNPVTFNWVDPAKGVIPQLGFIAQQVLPIFPNLISTTSATDLTPDGTLSLNYIGFIAPLVKSVQQLAQEIADLADSFTTKELTFTRASGDEVDVHRVVADELCAKKSDGTNVCVTGDQLAAAISGTNATAPNQSSGSSSSSNPNTASTTPSTPPLIQINGENPAHVNVGESYSDLGATITSPQADLNLGITTFLNGTLASNIVIDTSAAATDSIDYVATDQNGLTSTSTRTVVIQAPAASDTLSASASSTVATSSPSAQ